MMKPITIKPKITFWVIGSLVGIFFYIFIDKRDVKQVVEIAVCFGLLIAFIKFRIGVILTNDYIESTSLFKNRINLNEIKRMGIKLNFSARDGRTASVVTIEGTNKELNLSAGTYSDNQLKFLLDNLFRILKEKKLENISISSELIQAVEKKKFIDCA